MRFFRLSLGVLLLGGIIFGVNGQRCGRYYQNGGVCANYKSNDDYVVYPEGQSLSDVESSFSSLAVAQGLATLRGNDLFLNNCVQAFTSFVCADKFLKCNPTNTTNAANTTDLVVEIVPPCQSTCTNAIKFCVDNVEIASNDTKEIIKEYILPYSIFPQNCTNSTFAENCNSSPQLTDKPKCFKPLIEDRVWVESEKAKVTDPRFCQNGCCLPCPQSYALYPSNQMEKGFLTTQILRTISAIGSGIMLFLYTILPGKRNHPSRLILFTSFSIFMYSSNVFFSILKPKAVQCVDEVVPSTQENNHFFCGFQGALLIFASYATAIWVGLIILNLHVHTVWNSNLMKDKYIYLNIIGWGMPTFLTAIAAMTKSISYQYATLCLVKVEVSDQIFFYPLAFVVIPSFFIHLSTLIYIYRASHKKELNESEFMTNRLHVLQAIRLQWRAISLAIILLFTIMFYWLFYFIKLGTIVNGTNNYVFLEEWTFCIQSGKGQDFCANTISSKFMPPYGLILAAEISTSLIGIYLVVIFSNYSLWKEWVQWLKEKFNSGKNKENQFMAI